MAPLSLSILLLPLTVSAWALPSYGYGKSNYYGLRQGKCEATTGPSPNTVVDSYIPISRADNVTSRSSIFFDNIRRGVDPSSGASRLARRQIGDLSSALGGAEYLIDIQFQDRWHKAVLDTGSSDTWLIQNGFQCTNAQGQNVDQSQCGFGAPYSGGYIWQAQDQNFQIVYGDGEYVQGSTGWADITIGGITVKNTQVNLGTRAFWYGDGISSGLVGLAFGSITNAYGGLDPSKNSPATRWPYDPIFTSMTKQGLSAPVFSIAMQRGQGGYVAFGGLPPVNFDQNAFATTPMQEFVGTSGSMLNGMSFYTITPDAVLFSGAASTQKSQYIIDSGTTLIHTPTTTARAVNSLFSPRAVQQSNGVWTVDCAARAPAFGVKIGGRNFVVNPKDMIQKDAASGACLSAIQDGGANGPFILGDVFLNNVVAVFDVGAAQMRFAPHDY